MKFIKLIIIISLYFVVNLHSQTLEGTSGLLYIPTAEIQQDATVILGTSFVNKSVVSFGSYSYDAVTPYISMAFLPNLEIGVKITRLVDFNHETEGIGDRTVSLRIRVIEENDIMPAIAVGLHDVFTVFGGTDAIHNNALYVVSTKNLSLHSTLINSISLTAGYGTDRLKANNHNFVGIFGGMSFQLIKFLYLMAEYDGTHSNGGFRINLFNHISILGGYLQYKYFSGGACFYFTL
jgi:hypothetical protein